MNIMRLMINCNYNILHALIRRISMHTNDDHVLKNERKIVKLSTLNETIFASKFLINNFVINFSIIRESKIVSISNSKITLFNKEKYMNNNSNFFAYRGLNKSLHFISSNHLNTQHSLSLELWTLQYENIFVRLELMIYNNKYNLII